MKSRKKSRNKVISLLIVFAMIISMIPLSIIPAIPASAAPADLERAAAYSLEEGNIARDALATAQYTNTYMPADAPTRVNDGAFAEYLHGTSWNSYGGPNPVWIQLQWDSSRVIDSTRVMWAAEGASSNVRLPLSVRVQYWNGTEFVDVSNMKEPSGADVTSLGVVGEYGPSTTDCSNMRQWNAVTFDPVVTDQLRLVMTVVSNRSTGIGEWEVFGYKDPAVTDLALIPSDFLKELRGDVELPTTGANGSTITWSNSTDPVALANDGEVTRPAIGESDVAGKITATAVNGEFTATKEFDFLVCAELSDEEIVAAALDSINLGNTTNRTTNFTFPKDHYLGAAITWDTGNSRYLWTDGSVLRPPAGQADVTVTLTATAKYGDAEDTHEWTVTIPAYPESGRSIASYEPINIDCPQGNAPKLPNLIKITYSNGESELRRVRWEGYTTTAQTTQAGYAVGYKYTLGGNVLGDNAIASGYQVTANITVVEDEAAVPSNDPVAETVPLNKVTINEDPDGQDNRLTQNRDGHIEYILGVNVSRMLYNYRDTFGLSTSGYSTPGGWDSTTTKLKGHGYGHYLSGLALAYASGATEDQKTQLMSRMKRMTDEMREMQELTFVEHPTEDRYLEARDIYSTDAEVNAMVDVRLNDTATAPKDPANFGYGYINAIQPEHLILIENYAPYDGDMDNYGVWAPYYSLHKQLAGLVEIYNVLDGGTAEEQAVADKAFDIARDMGMWVWNRLYYCTKPGTSPTGTSTSNTTPGHRDSMWGLYIAGEYGGVNETLARLSDIMKKKGNTEDSGKLLQASMYFDNNGSSSDTGNIPYFSSLANNRDSIRTLHANQHIPQIIGALWNFKGSNDAKYYNIAENFWDYIFGRYSFTIGGVGGNNSNEEKFAGTYNQSGVVDTNQSGKICETCAAYNMLKLTKDLNTYNPDDAKYMDYYERLLYNQMVGSIVPGSSSNQVSYGYSIYPNTTRSRSTGNANNPGNTCCSGTGTENHVKYQEAAYFTSADNKTFYVGLYMPTTAEWDAQDVTIEQSCVFPSQESTFTVTPGTGSGQFEMKFRVPYWATKGFDIKLNGVSIAESYEPSSYVSTGVRTWAATDTVVVTMPYGFNVDYLPGKNNSEWYGSLMQGPLVMAATDVSSISRVELDSYMSTGEGTNVIINEPATMTGGTSGEAATNNVPNLSVEVTPGTTGGTAATKTFIPHYFAGIPAYTTYFYIPAPEENTGVNKMPLFNKIVEAMDRADTGMYTDESIRAMEEGALTSAAAAYQSAETTAEQMEAAIAAIQEAIDNLTALPVDISELLDKITEAKALAEKDYTPDSFANLQSEMSDADAYEAGNNYTNEETANHIFMIDYAIQSLVLLDRTSLEEALDSAAEKVNPPNTGEKLWEEHEFTVYTRKSWNAFKKAEADALNVYNDDPKVPTQSEIQDAIDELNSTMNALLPYILCDEREPLAEAIEEAKEYTNVPQVYTEESFAELQNLIKIAEEDKLEYASLTFAERDGVINGLKKAIADLDISSHIVLEAKEAAIKAAEEAKEAAEAAKADADKAKTDAEAAEAAAETAASEAEKAKTEAENAKTEADKAETEANKALAEAGKAATEAQNAVAEAEKAAAEAEKAKTEADRAKVEADKALAEAGNSETARLAAEEAQKAAEEAQGKAEAAQNAAAEAQEKAEEAQGKAETAQGKAEAAQSAAETAKDEAKAAQLAAETAEGKAEVAATAAQTAKDGAAAAQLAAEAAATAAQTAKTAAESAKDDAEAAKTAAEAARDQAVSAKNDAAAAQVAVQTAKNDAVSARDEAVTAKNEAVAAKTAAEAARVQAEAAKADAEAAKAAAEAAKAAAEAAKAEAISAKTDAQAARADALAAKAAAEAAAAAAEKAKEDAEKAKQDAEKAKEDAEKAAAEAAQKKEDAEAARLAAEKAQKAAEDALKAAQAAQAAAEARQKELNEVKQALTEANKNAKKDADALALSRRKVKINSAKRTNNKIKVTLKKDAAAVGYQIQYSLKKTFKGKSVAKGKAVTKTTKNTSYTTGSLQKKTYYVRARAYTTDSKGKRVYGKWSGTKTVRANK